MKKITSLLILMLCLTITNLNAQYTWRTKACLPAPGRVGGTSFSIGTKGYYVGGYNASVNAYNEVWEYDEPTNNWTKKNNFPGVRSAPSSFVINDTAYVGLGLDVAAGVYHAEFYRYNQANDSWIQVANFPGSPRYTAMAFAINGKGYIGCGKGSGQFNDFYQYDPSTNAWTKEANFPGSGRQNGLGAAAGNFGYMGMGVNTAVLTDVYKYDPTTNTWTAVANFSGPIRFGANCFVINGEIYLAGGNGTISNTPLFYTDCWKYTPSTNAWTQQASFACAAITMQNNYGGFAINNHGYYPTGQGQPKNGATTYFSAQLLEFSTDDLTFINSSNILGADTSYCGPFSRTLSTGNACAQWSTGATGSQITVTTPGIYWATYSDTCGMKTDTITIKAGSVSNVHISASGPTSFCQGSSVTLDAGAGYDSYKWSDNETSRTISVTQSGSYSAVVTSGGCKGNSDTITVNVTNTPVATITANGPTTFCQGGSVTLDAGAGYDSYKWSDNETSRTISVTQTGDYSVIVTSGICQGNSNIVHVTVNNNPAPLITANGPTTFCTGGSVTLDAGAGYDSYKWSDNETSRTISVTQTGDYSVIVTAGTCQGNSTTVHINVSSNPVPTVTANGPTTFCTGGSVTLDAGAGYNSYQWSDNETSRTISVTQTGDYSVVVTAGSCQGTSTTTHVTVNSNPTPSITANGPTTFCQGGSVTLDAGAGYDSYKWSDNETSRTITVTQNGTYSVAVTSGTCTGNSTGVKVTVNANPTPTITPAGPITICQGKSITLDGGAGYSAYSWSNQATSRTISVTQAGNYTDTVTQNGCRGISNTVVVSISQTPPVAICKGTTVTLSNGQATISASDVDGGSTASCGIASKSISKSTFVTADTGTKTIILTITDSSGHSSTCSAAVVVKAPATNNCSGFSSSITPVQSTGCNKSVEDNPYVIYLGYGSQNIKLSATATGTGPFSYLWSPKTNLSCSTCAAPVFTPTAEGLYTFNVTVTNSAGCKSTSSITICVLDIRVAKNGGGCSNGNDRDDFCGFGYNKVDKVYLCHYPPGCTTNPQTLSISTNAISAHIPKHKGDHLGRCNQVCGSSKMGDETAELIPSDENGNGFDLVVYPNPFINEFHVSIESEQTAEIDMKVYSITGQLVANLNAVQPNSDVTIGSELQKGVYLVEITQGEFRKVIRIVKAD